MNLLGDIFNGEELISTLKSGGLVVMPTDTLYGVVGSSLNKETVERIYDVRGRDENKPCIILIGDLSQLKKFSIEITEEQKKIIESSSRPTSFVLDCVSEKFTYLHRGNKTLAFRIPQNSNLKNLLHETGPLSAPSANLQGLPPATNIQQAKKYFGDKIDMYIDGGEINGEPSRVIRLHSDGTTEVLR